MPSNTSSDTSSDTSGDTSSDTTPLLSEPGLRDTPLLQSLLDPSATTPNRSKRRGGWRRFLAVAIRRLVILAVTVGLVPVALIVIYSFEGVKPVSTLMLYDTLRGRDYKRDWVAFDAIAPPVWQSVVSSEDGKFCSHNGVDWEALNTVIDDAMEGERTRGASTIPMQNAKNLFLWSSRSYVRKAFEVPLAMLTDLMWSKRRQMEIYLNIAEWGNGVYGVGAAARSHFKRSAKRLTRRQSALLAVSLPNPKVRRPARPTRGLSRLARVVERRARASGAYVTCLRG
ncbi:MAG: monofunctional biosynthetic peptidoglycan transglycosylase [Pseudomonadota bacterium]